MPSIFSSGRFFVQGLVFLVLLGRVPCQGQAGPIGSYQRAVVCPRVGPPSSQFCPVPLCLSEALWG